MHKIMVPVASAVPLHGVVDQDLLRRLAESMTRNGWAGRPLLGVDQGIYVGLLTGSHRYAAARLAGLDEIPVLLLTVSDIKNPDEIDEEDPHWGLDGLFIEEELRRIGAPAKAITLAKRES